MFEHWKDFLHPHEGNDHHPHAYRKASAIALTCVVGVVLLISALQTGYVRQSSGFLSSVLPSVLVDITNENRLAEGLTEVEQNDTLTQAAQLKANHMADNGYFAHDSPGGVTPWHWFEEAGYGYEHAGENLAVNYSDSQDVVEAWMESRLHRENILEKDFTEIGIATARGQYEGKETVFVVQMFGTPNDRELAQRRSNSSQNGTGDQPTEEVEDDQGAEDGTQEQTTSTEQLVAQLSQQVAQVQEDVGNANVDGQQAGSELQPEQQATPTNAELTQSNTQSSPSQPATTTATQSADTQSGQDETTADSQAQQDRGQLLAQQSNEQSRESTNQQPQLEFATPTEASMGSVAGESGISLAPPPGTGWFDYLLSRPHLLFQLAMYTLVGLVLVTLLVSIGFEVKHHHFWQAGVSFVAVLLIVVVYLFAQDLLFMETVVAGVS